VVAFAVFGAVVALVVVDRGGPSTRTTPRPGEVQTSPGSVDDSLVVTLSASDDGGLPAAIGTFGDQSADACLISEPRSPDSDTVRICDPNTQPLLVPEWTHVRFEGDFTSLQAWFEDDLGQRHGPSSVPDVRGDEPLWFEARFPGDRGFAVFRLDVAATAAGSVTGHLSDVLEMTCDDGVAHVLTPLVTVGPEGMRTEVSGPPGWRVEIRPLEPPIDRWVVPVAGDDSRATVERVWSASELVTRCLPPGAAEPIHRAEIRPDEDLFRTVDTDGSFAHFLPWCPTDDLVRFTVQGGPSEPASAADVRPLIDGIRPSDGIDQGAYPGQGMWTIERADDGVVAFIRFPERDGFACRGSGLFGT
jgi:hypothetical protein